MALAEKYDELLEQRLVEITRATSFFFAVLRSYRTAQRANDHATAEGLAGWLAGHRHDKVTPAITIDSDQHDIYSGSAQVHCAWLVHSTISALAQNKPPRFQISAASFDNSASN